MITISSDPGCRKKKLCVVNDVSGIIPFLPLSRNCTNRPLLPSKAEENDLVGLTMSQEDFKNKWEEVINTVSKDYFP